MKRKKGKLLDSLAAGQSLTITDPIQTFSGLLADGSSLELEPRAFDSGSRLAVTLAAPEPNVLPRDVSLDGAVDF